MKFIRILLACSFSLIASAAFVRAEATTEKKPDAACCSMEKKAEKKAEKAACCSKECTEKCEKKEEKKS